VPAYKAEQQKSGRPKILVLAAVLIVAADWRCSLLSLAFGHALTERHDCTGDFDNTTGDAVFDGAEAAWCN